MQKKTKTALITITIVVLIGGGLALLLYPFITNMIAARQEARQLSEWEQQAETIQEEPEVIAEPEEAEPEETTEEEAIVEWSENISMQAEVQEDLQAEDYFPLKITIPAIEVEAIVSEGTDRETLKKGPGHIIGTPFPGETGRCTISGHRTTYGAPFNRVDELSAEDLIYLDSVKGETYVYAVTKQEIVKPTDVHILEGNDKKELLLTACHPKYSAAYRIIIYAELVNIYPIGDLS